MTYASIKLGENETFHQPLLPVLGVREQERPWELSDVSLLARHRRLKV